MRILVVGAGKVGFEIAQRLSAEEHDVTVVDQDPEALKQISARLDVLTVIGNGASPRLLEELGIGTTDLMIAVTDMDEVNMIACMVAKQYGAYTCVARIRNPDYASERPYSLSLTRLGIDRVIDPERLAALEIERLLRMPMATEVDTFADGQITIVGLEVDSNAIIVGSRLSQVQLPNLLIVALVRDGTVIIPTGEDTIRGSDHLFVVGRTCDLPSLRTVLRQRELRIRRIAIIGAGRVGRNLAAALGPGRTSGMHVMLLEKDPHRAQAAADALPHALVIQGDGTKIDTLREEGVDECDALVAVSGEDHTNLLSTMLAKELGVNEVIAEVTREDYVPLAKRAGADAVIIPRLLTVASVLRYVRKGHILSMTILHEGKAEALELVAGERSAIVDRPLREVRFPRGAIVGAVVQDGNATVARGDTIIRPQDRVIVFTLPEAVPKVEGLFRSTKQAKAGQP